MLIRETPILLGESIACRAWKIEINDYASLSIMSEASNNRYNNTIQQALRESIKTCINFYRYLTCLIHFGNEFYIDGPT